MGIVFTSILKFFVFERHAKEGGKKWYLALVSPATSISEISETVSEIKLERRNRKIGLLIGFFFKF